MTTNEMLSKEMILQHLKCLNHRIHHMTCSGCYSKEKGCPFERELNERQKNEPFPIDRCTWVNTFEWRIMIELFDLRRQLSELNCEMPDSVWTLPFENFNDLMINVNTDD